MASSQNNKRTGAKKTASKTTSSKTKQKKPASGRKRTTSGTKASSVKTATGQKRKSGRMSEYEKKQMLKRKSGMYDEIKLLIALAAASILLISTLDFGGRVGGLISYFLFGVFGWIAYLIPYIVFFGTAFIISNRQSRTLTKKVLASVLLCLSVMAFLQMLISPADTTANMMDYYRNCAIYKNGGGIIGGVICHFLVSVSSRPIAMVIIIFGMLVGVVLLAQRAIFTVLFGKIKAFIQESSVQHAEKKRLMAEIAQEDAQKEEQAREEAQAKAASKAARQAAAMAEAKTVSSVSEEDALPKDFKLADVDILEPAQASAQVPEETITVTHMEPIRFEEVTEEPVHTPEDVSDETVRLPIEEIQNAADESSSPANDKAGTETPLPVYEPAQMTPEEAAAAAGVVPAQTSDGAAEKKRSKTKSENPVPEDIKPEEIKEPVKAYVFPPVDLLKRGDRGRQPVSDTQLKSTAVKLQQTLESFGVKVKVTNVSCGPSVTRYELSPEQGVKVSRIVSLADDIKLNLAVADIRIEAPIPGKSAVGIEVPNKENATVCFRDLVESAEFKKSKSKITFAVGRDISGSVIVTDIAKMPHLLIAGATGSGKSVCINTLIMSIIYKSKPEDVRLIMVDPKVVELSVYNGIPHLLIPVVTDPKKAAGALNWAVAEMTDRYQKFAQLNVRDIQGYNEKIEKLAKEHLESETYKKLPQIVIIVDELADLMMVAPGEVEDAICRLAQLARAAGLHLVIATQRPSVNVITGLIKANIPSRIAFSVSSGVDSRTIIDMNGAEKLMGKGDMLFYPAGLQKPVRVQGAFISDSEVNAVVDFLSAQGQTASYSDEVAQKIETAKTASGNTGQGAERDVYFEEAGKFIIEKDKASIGMLQRVYKIGFNRAARIMDQLCEAGVVGPEEGTKPRKVLMTADQFQQYIDEYL